MIVNAEIIVSKKKKAPIMWIKFVTLPGLSSDQNKREMPPPSDLQTSLPPADWDLDLPLPAEGGLWCLSGNTNTPERACGWVKSPG